MNIIYIGSSGPLSTFPLKALIHPGVNVCAVACDNTGLPDNNFAKISMINPSADSVDALAHINNIPLISLTHSYVNNIKEIAYHQPDLIIVSCYARKLPDAILRIPRLGCFNLHPSILPAYRGPDPVFWQLRNAEKVFGVTLHRMTESFDKGAIVNQKHRLLNDGLTGLQISELIAKVATELLFDTLDNIKVFIENEKNQDEDLASYQAFPGENDFILSTLWTAQRMYNFMCAYSSSGRYFICQVKGAEFHLSRALAYEAGSQLEQPYLIEDSQIKLACSSGFIRCQLALNPL